MTLAAVVAFAKRIGAWLVANPLVAAILGLLVALAGETGRRRWAQAQQAKAERKATVATVEGKAAVIAEQRHQAEAECVEVAGELAQESARDDKAARAAEDAVDARQKIADKWKAK